MDNNTNFMFDISKLVKDFYETAVVFLTRKDYSSVLFKKLCCIQEALLQEDNKHALELIVDYHLHWLYSVNELENFTKSIATFNRNDFSESISFTIDSLTFRMRCYQTYIEQNKSKLAQADQANLKADLEIVDEMHRDITRSLLEKIKNTKNLSDEEFTTKVEETVDELLQWFDKINDGLSMTLCKYVARQAPQLDVDLPRTLQEMVAELKTVHTASSQKVLRDLKKQGKEIGTMIRFTTSHSLEMNKVLDKINALDERIKRLQIDTTQPSAALLALKNKRDFLLSRVKSLENLRTNIKSVQQITNVPVEDIPEEEVCVCEDYFQLRIFNHSLPVENRERLVTDYCYLWDKAVLGESSDKSIISILSAAEMKEEFSDELGTFYIDEYSRKIYKLPDDETLYQPNDRSELVPVCDDAEHIYCYDECGRYYIDDQTRQRVYKAHATASEYMMDSSGVLLKVKEEVDGITYYYDNYGRYYINSEGKHIYRDADTVSEYENDGLGNLVRIRSHADMFDPCPGDANVTEDFRYLKETVGKALRECIAQVVLHQPSDPIKYLSTALIKYRKNMEIRDQRGRELEELNAEREIIAAEERAEAEKAAMEDALLMQGGSEASFDSNLIKYSTMYVDEHPQTPKVNN